VSQKTSDFINNLFKSSFTTLNILLNSKRNNIKKDKQGSVIVLANGPSIKEVFNNKEELNQITKTDSLCVNHFYKSEFFIKIKPNYYIISAPELWLKEVNKEHTESRIHLFTFLQKNVDWRMTFFVPFQAKQTQFWQNLLNQNDLITIEYYNITPIEGFKKSRYRRYNKQLGTPRCHNVVGYSLMTLIWKGYTKIGLLGVDHTWTKSLFVSENNEAFLSQPHFYNPEAGLQKMDSKGKENEDKRTLHAIIHKFYLAFKSYFEINNYSLTKNVKIINLTKGSFIDAFERSNVSVFSQNNDN